MNKKFVNFLKMTQNFVWEILHTFLSCKVIFFQSIKDFCSTQIQHSKVMSAWIEVISLKLTYHSKGIGYLEQADIIWELCWTRSQSCFLWIWILYLHIVLWYKIADLHNHLPNIRAFSHLLSMSEEKLNTSVCFSACCLVDTFSMNSYLGYRTSVILVFSPNSFFKKSSSGADS